MAAAVVTPLPSSPDAAAAKRVGHAEAAHVDPQQQDAHQQSDVADAGHHEGFLCGFPGAGALEPEADEQVGAQAHQLPRDVQQQEVVGQRQGQHRRHE